MHFSIRAGEHTYKVNISEKDLGKLRNSEGSKDKAVKAAMTCWQKIMNYFSGDLHEQAFGHLYDFLQAQKSYRYSNCTEAERISFKKIALSSMDSLRRLAKPEHQGIFQPVFDEDNGQFVFNFMSADTMEKIDPNVEWTDENNVDDDAVDVRSFDSFENGATRSHWENMRHCFDQTKKPAAIRLLAAAYEAPTLSERISAFGKLSELANATNKEKFHIRIRDSKTCAAKISCHVGKDIVFFDSAKPGEDLAEAFVDCPRNLFGNEAPKGRCAKMMYALGKVSRDEFDTIFTRFKRRTAVTALNDMCRSNSKVTEENINKLFKLSDKRGTEPARSNLDGNIKKIFNLSDESIAAPKSAGLALEHEMEVITKKVIPRLDTMLNMVFSKAQLTGQTKLMAQRDLDKLMTEIFGKDSTYTSQAKILIANHLKEPAKNPVIMANWDLRQAYIAPFLKGQP